MIRKINSDKKIKNNTGSIITSAGCGTNALKNSFIVGYGNGNKVCDYVSVSPNSAPILDLDSNIPGINKSAVYVDGAGLSTIGLSFATITDANNDELHEIYISVNGLTEITSREVLKFGATHYPLDNINRKGTATHGNTTFIVRYFGKSKLFVITPMNDTIPLADAITMIRAIRYSSTLLSETSPDRYINFVVNDGRKNSNTAILDISYSPV